MRPLGSTLLQGSYIKLHEDQELGRRPICTKAGGLVRRGGWICNEECCPHSRPTRLRNRRPRGSEFLKSAISSYRKMKDPDAGPSARTRAASSDVMGGSATRSTAHVIYWLGRPVQPTRALQPWSGDSTVRWAKMSLIEWRPAC